MNSDLLREVSVDKAFAHAKWLCEEVGERMSGTEEEKKVVEYYRRVFQAEGISFAAYELDGFVSFPIDGSISVTSPEPWEIECNVFAQIISTPPEGVKGELVFVGAGGYEDYEGKDVRDKIVLTELSYAPPRPEKVRIALEKGAIGVAMMNWGLPEHGTLPCGTVKPIWGNPTPDNFEKMVKIPVLGLRRRDGEKLASLCRQQRVEIVMKAKTLREWRKIILPMAKIEGSGKEKDQFVIVGGHYDCWKAGATCNGTGNGATLEIARALNKYKAQLNRSVWFVFWPGHETGVMEGSSWFVDYFWRDLNKNALIYLNLDSLGMRDTVEFYATGSREAKDFHLNVEKNVLHTETKHQPLKKTGDQSFFGIGVPALYGRTHHSPEQMKEWHGATLGWWYHSDEDTLDKVDLAKYEMSLKVNCAYVWELCTSRVIPFEFVGVSEEINQRLEALNAICGQAIDLNPGIALARELRKESQYLAGFDGKKLNDAQAELLNRTILKMSRILIPLTSSVIGKYGQDSYGLTALSTKIPALYELEALGQMDPASHDYKLLYTKMLRERNRAFDTIEAALELVETTKERMKALE